MKYFIEYIQNNLFWSFCMNYCICDFFLVNFIMENRISLKNLGGYFNPWKIMLMILTDLSRFFQGNKFISTNFMPMFPSNVIPHHIQNDEFRLSEGDIGRKKG